MIVLVHGSRAWGAVENYAEAVVGGLAAARVEATVLYPAVSELGRLGAAGVRGETFEPALLDAAAPAVVSTLVRRLRRLRPRLVHVIDFWPGAVIAARLSGARRVLVTHHTPELRRGDSAIGRLLWRLAWLTRPEVVYTSETDRRADGSRLRTHVVYYGIDLARFLRAKPAFAGGCPVVGCVSRIEPQKGLDLLVAAAPAILERHPDARFVLAGEGSARAGLESEVEARGLGGRFMFLGHRDDVPDVLASFDVFALPSHFEGLCYAVIEAQAVGVPVVATPVGGIPENVVPGETGVLVPAGDAGALAAAIVRLLDDRAEAARLAAEARRRVLERYPVERMVEETLALYGQGRT